MIMMKSKFIVAMISLTGQSKKSSLSCERRREVACHAPSFCLAHTSITLFGWVGRGGVEWSGVEWSGVCMCAPAGGEGGSSK